MKRALYRVNTNNVFSSWTDSLVKGAMEDSLYLDSIERLYDRQKGVFIEENEIEFDRDMNEVVENLWSIGGKRGWYYMDWAWEIRGFLDKLVGGVGLRRGRRSENLLEPGDALDFWRVLIANRRHKHLLLFAEMKLPGEAWLEFKIKKRDEKKESRKTKKDKLERKTKASPCIATSQNLPGVQARRRFFLYVGGCWMISRVLDDTGG